jgi:hypothetical protein
MMSKQKREIAWLSCESCDHSHVILETSAPVGMINFNDKATCPSCGLEGHAEVDSPEEAYICWNEFE